MTRLGLQKLCTYLVSAVLLFVAGWYAHVWYQRNYLALEDRRVRLGGFRFISPLVDVELPEGYGVRREPIPFKRRIKELVDQQIASGLGRSVSVYFRDLSDGPWFGINKEVVYHPASMMKVPVMIAWLKRAERNPQELYRPLYFEGKQDLSSEQTIRPAKTLTPGASYPVEELLHYMLSYSDNNAMKLLFESLDQDELGDVLLSMDIENHPGADGNSLNVHGFSGFFRILYNAAYLNREMSEKALQLLSVQDFPQGIVAGVPKGTVVASKFGEISSDVPADGLELHEFGIVYHPKGPYILGIMTRGRNLANQARIIREISARVYSEVDTSLPATSRKP